MRYIKWHQVYTSCFLQLSKESNTNLIKLHAASLGNKRCGFSLNNNTATEIILSFSLAFIIAMFTTSSPVQLSTNKDVYECVRYWNSIGRHVWLNNTHLWGQGPDSIQRRRLNSIANPIVKIRWSYDRLISTNVCISALGHYWLMFTAFLVISHYLNQWRFIVT